MGKVYLAWLKMCKRVNRVEVPPVFSGGRGELSCVSMKSNRSMGEPLAFSSGGGEPSYVSMKSEQSMGKPLAFSSAGEPSCVSMKSNRSMGEPLAFSGGKGEPSYVSMKSEQSMGEPLVFSGGRGEPSCVSMKSDRSMGEPLAFSGGRVEPSCVSMKSNRSMGEPLAFSGGRGEPNCMSMKSDPSMGEPLAFSGGGGEPSCVSMKSDRSMGEPLAFSVGGGEPSCVSVKSDRSMGEPLAFSVGAAPSHKEHCPTEAAPFAHTLLGGSGSLQQDSHQSIDDVIKRHKSSMKDRYEILFEGSKTEENKTLLNRIYTQLYIIEGESEGVNEEHEVLQIEKTPRRHGQDTPIDCSDIFKPLQDHKGPRHKEIKGYKGSKVPDVKSVLTKGIAGIGKTVSVQKFILDWAEGKVNQDIDFMFVLPFRELNLIKDHQYSLHGLLCDFHPELKDLDPKIYNEYKAVFIFDGLDESRISLNFSQCEKVSNITWKSSVGVLMTNLIEGELLPSSLIWITCRPAAANQIPPKHIKRVTEIQGFTNLQKEKYFRKRISDQDQAQKIISHIKTVRSLHIMCHIPIFCWISATVLQRIMKQCQTEIPKTLTEMYSHFLITQTNIKNEKYEVSKNKRSEGNPTKLLESNRTILLKLAELAFTQLMKGNVMFYEEDLTESGIDVTDASVYSGVFTEIFREECVLYQKKVYCFVHLSFQEFLAAVYVFHCYESRNEKVLNVFKPKFRRNVPMDEVLIGAVKKSIDSQNGHLDLFIRFLLGMSLKSNQRLLWGLLTVTLTPSETTTEYIKDLIKGEASHMFHMVSTERSINLFFCLSEMKDQTLSREIQEYLNLVKHSKQKLSPRQCSALACMLLTSEKVLEELDLKKYNTWEEGYRRLIPALTVCRRVVLASCDLTKTSCKTLYSALKSINSSLKELDLSYNDLQDSGVELISAGLKSSHCKLEILRFAGCDLTEKSCETLCSALQSENSSLKKLDLSYNDLQDSGVELLSAGLKSSECKLEILKFAGCDLTKKSCETLCSALQSVNSSLKKLDLSNNDLQDSGVELLSAGLKSSHCKLQILKFAGCDLTKKSCETLCSALQSVNSSLEKLDLSYNDLEDSGVELLSAGLKSSECKLEILKFAGCDLTKKSCETLCSALQSVNSSLKKLDLCNNDLQDSGVELLSAGLKSLHCKLQILKLSGCMFTEKSSFFLAAALKSNPSHLRELDLTYNHLGQTEVKELSDLLEDPHCKLEKMLVDHGGKHRVKPGMEKYACKLTLDPNTAHTCFSLSDGNRKVKHVEEDQLYLDHPDRFDYWEQVLSVESLTGRCYFEVECRSGRGADIAVSYRGIGRKGNGADSEFGSNYESWSLRYYNNRYSVHHNNMIIFKISHASWSERVGVYVDWKAGILSFYIISPNTRTQSCLYTLCTTFTEPLYAGFRVHPFSSVHVK